MTMMKHPITDNRERLEFLIWFSNFDLNSARTGDLLNTVSDISVFCSTFDEPGIVLISKEKYLPSVVRPELKGSLMELQKRVRKLIGEVIEQRNLIEYEANYVPESDVTYPFDNLRWELPSLRFGIRPRISEDSKFVERPFLSVHGTRNDLFLFMALFLITNSPERDRILLCAQCGNPFVKGGSIKNQKHCSAYCMKKAINMRYLDKLEKRQKQQRAKSQKRRKQK